MRSVGCVLDIFSGISKWAAGARTPFISIDERLRYVNQKEYEIDDLLIDKTLPKKYLFSFPSIIGDKENELQWKSNFFDLVSTSVISFLSTLDKDKLPDPIEKEEVVLYENVRRKHVNKMGVKFLKINKGLRSEEW
jgi:hypothetical protein